MKTPGTTQPVQPAPQQDEKPFSYHTKFNYVFVLWTETGSFEFNKRVSCWTNGCI